MRKYVKRLLALCLVLALCIPTVASVIAADNSMETGSGSTGSDSWGSSGGGLIIGLGRCEWDVYTGAPGSIDDLYNWIADYSYKYYEKVQGGCYYYNVDRSACSSLASGNKILGSGGDPLGILESLSNDSAGEYLEKVANGWAVKKDKVPEVMEALKDCNEDLYRQYCDNPFGTDGHPVVIVVESVANMSNGKGYTVESVANQWGASVYGMDLSAAPTINTLSWRSSVRNIDSATAKVIFDSTDGSNFNNTMRGRLIKAMFGLNRRGNIGDESHGHHGYAAYAADGNALRITGCYILSCGGIPTEGPSTEINYLHGVYQWDFDSVDIPVNSRSHEEDGYAEKARGSAISGKFDFGYVDLKNSSAPAWRAYGDIYGGDSVDLELRVYGLGTGNGIDNYSTDTTQLLGAGNANADGVVSGLAATYSKTGVGWDEFVTALTNGTPDGFEFDDMSGGKVPATISASMTNGMVAVGYFTELYVTPHCGGPMAGKKIQFVCNQVHYAVYTFNDETRTYKLAQTNLQGWSQLKDNSIGNAVFEAQSGTPTTEDMFISMGGSEYLVNMQYALHVEDYDRKYTVTAEPFANYMYYRLGLPASYDQGQKFLANSGTYQWTSGNHETSGAVAGRTDHNLGFKANQSMKAMQVTKFKDSVDDYLKQVQMLFDELDENATNSTSGHRYDPKKKYDVIVTKGITVDGNGKLIGIESHVFGADGDKVSATKNALEQLSQKLQALVAFKKGLGGSESNRNWAKNTVKSYAFNIPNVTFVSTVNGKNDFDSAAHGDVKVSFVWNCDNTQDYEYSDKIYYDHSHHANVVKTAASHGNGHSHSLEDIHDVHGASIVCASHVGNSVDLHESSSCGTSVPDPTATDPNNTRSCGEHTCSGKSCPGPTIDHLKHSGGTISLGAPATPGTYASKSTHESVTRSEQWCAIFQGKINIAYSDYNGSTAFTRENDDLRGKNLSYNSTLHQIYKSVKYMDIVEAHVWRLGGGVADGNGLSDLMVAETDTRVITPIIEMACSNLGYKLYNTQSAKQKGHWAESLVTPTGPTYEKVWTAIDQEFVDLCIMDEEDETLGEMSANTELAAIGRLANSFNPGSSEVKQFFASGNYGNKQALTAEGEGDALTFVYNIEEQGGWSHWSFDGLLKQAMALTFYESEKPETAYRNYIIVQSDYLALGEQNLTMSGMQWQSKTMDEDDGTWGLTQAILNSGTYMDAADIANYYPKGEPWRHYGFDESPTANTTQQHLAGTDVSQGSGGADEVVGKSKPSDKTASMAKYAEGPEDWGVYAEYKVSGDDGNTFVVLDENAEYASMTTASMTGTVLTGTVAQNANFGTEGKGSSATNLAFDGNIMPIVGYVGAQDSVLEDKHVYTPGGGGSTGFNPDQTLVSGEWSGVSFDLYGSSTHSSHLYEDTGSSAAGAAVVSASGNPKNRVISMGTMFPYVIGLNVIRWKPNNTYGGYETALYYDECLSFFEAHPGVTSLRNVTTDAVALKSGVGQYTDSVIKDLHQEGHFDMILDGEVIGIGGADGLLTGVSYDGATRNSSGNTNTITIFNPSTATNVAILPMSKELPDGQNNWRDDSDHDVGYGIRDQRVSETNVESQNQETYLSYTTLDQADVVNKTKEYVYTLKPQTSYKSGITEYYTMDDYVTNSAGVETWTVAANSEPLTIIKSGTYRLTLYDGADRDTSVELHLESGDQLTTDGTSIYLNRGEDVAPIVTYEQMVNSIAKYYQSVDSVTQTGQALMQENRIANYIATWSDTVSDIRNTASSLNYDWPGITVVDNVTPLNATIAKYNESVAWYNARITELYSQLGSVYGGYQFVSEGAYEDMVAIQNKIMEVRDQIMERANELSVTCELSNITMISLTTPTGKPPVNWLLAQHSSGYYMLIDSSGNPVESNGVRTFYLPGNYTNKVYAKEKDGKWLKCNQSGTFDNPEVELSNANPQWFDYSRYYDLQRAEVAMVDSVFASSSLDSFLSDIRALLYKCYEQSSGNDAQARYLTTVVTTFNAFVNNFIAEWNAVNGKISIPFANGYDELFAFMYDMDLLRSEIINVATRNSQIVNCVTIPSLEIVATEGKAATFKHADRFDVERGATLAMDFSGLGMSAGSTLVVRVPYDDYYSNPATASLAADGQQLDFNSVKTGLNNTAGYSYTLYTYQDGTDWVYVIEALDTCTLGQFRLVFNHDASILDKSSDASFYYVSFDKIWLCDVGSEYVDPVYLGTTIEHNHYEAGSNYWNNATRKRSVNKLLFDAVGAEATVSVTKKTNTLYVSRENDSKLILKSDAADNPHKVYNANWRYYVVGWETLNGAKVTSPTDPKLSVDTTILKWPSAASGTITVKELRDTACLVKYNGDIYLTTKDAGLEHKILETGIKVSKFDYWTLGPSGLPERDIVSAEPNTYPMGANTPAKQDTVLTRQDFRYEFFFTTTDEDAPLFNVEWSQSIAYRFSKAAITKIYSDDGDWSLDWNRKEQATSGNVIISPGRQPSNATANYISLDDEFDVYFDNVGAFQGDENSYNDHVNSPNAGLLGYGWNANGIKLLGDDVNKGISSWYGGGSDGVGDSDVEIEDESGTHTVTRQTTECTGWIYAKYLTFNIDVYVFKENGKVNPTLDAYDKNGNLRDIELVEAGTPVYLGEYLGSHSDAADNRGGFLDYGAPEVTKSKSGEPFVYHFWCPLYNGEHDGDVKVYFHTVNINDTRVTGNPGGNNNVGENNFGLRSPTNNEEYRANDDRHANNEVSTSVVGRIGALTIADTGDPRYSDSFKTAIAGNNSVDNYLIYPIVRKILEYSNSYSGHYKSSDGSQRGVVIDPFDVRGRICAQWMVDYVAGHHAGWNDGMRQAYKVYASESYDTYGTQWYKHTITRYSRGNGNDSRDVQWAMALPLTPDFNKHETFANKPLRVGYEVYLSVESIGDYYGDSQRPIDDEESVTNGNNDYQNNKLQVRPFYAAIDAKDGDGNSYNGPVDVYMRAGDTYVLINSGCDRVKNDGNPEGTVCKDTSHSISQVLAVMYNNYNPNYIETNSGDTVTELDQNMLRRMVTGGVSAGYTGEADVTKEVLELKPGAKSILTKVSSDTGGIGGMDLDIRYTYGCSQMLFLRERNLTYVGGPTAALDYTNPIPTVKSYLNKEHAQKWYFGLGLPSSAVFVPHGKDLTDKTVLVEGIVVNSIDVIAHGSVWTLHYESDVSKMSFDYEEGSADYTLWNPWHVNYPWLIPVTYYNIGDTSTADLDTQGSH